MPQENKRINPETGRFYPSEKEKLEELTASIENEIRDVFHKDNYKNYLSVMSHFHNYSVNNCLLIYMQNPGATKVASFKAWNDKFDRHVSKGAKGIKIIAPEPYKKKIEVPKVDPNTKEILLDSNGKAVLQSKEITVPAFKVSTVFDVGNTYGKPLPMDIKPLIGKENYEYFKEAIQKSSPVSIKFTELQGKTNGYYSKTDNTIKIREGINEQKTLFALIHEISNSLIHYDVNNSRIEEEIEADSIAYAVCRHFGVDTDEISFGHLSSLTDDKDYKELKEILESINNSTSFLISKIDENYKEIIAEKGQQDIEHSSMFKIGNKFYLQIQKIDDGHNVNYKFYRFDNFKLTNEGRTDYTGNNIITNNSLLDIAKKIASDFKLSTADISAVDEQTADKVRNPIPHKAQKESFTDKPCPELSQDELIKYGYTNNDMFPITKEMAEKLVRYNCDVYLVEDEGVITMVNDKNEIINHDGSLAVEKSVWNAISKYYREQQSIEEKEKTFFEGNKDGYAVYKPKQNKDDVYFSNSVSETQNRNFDKSRYSFVFSENIFKENKDKETILEGIVERLNFNKPEDYRSNNISIGDILALKQNGELSFHYVDNIGFKDVPNFIEPVQVADKSIVAERKEVETVKNDNEKSVMKEEKVPDNKKEFSADNRPSVISKLKSYQEKVKSLPDESDLVISNQMKEEKSLC